MIMKTMQLPVPTTQLTHAITDIVPDATVRNLLKSSNHAITPLVDALLNKENGRSEINVHRIYDAVTAVVIDFIIRKSKGKITREMCLPITEAIYASFNDGSLLNLTSTDVSARNIASKGTKLANSVASQIHSSISNAANKADFILSKLLLVLEEVAPIVLEEAEYEFERIFLVLVEGVKFALGREDNQFVMQLLYSMESLEGIMEDPLIEEGFQRPGCLRLWRLAGSVHPIAQQMIDQLFREEFEELDALEGSDSWFSSFSISLASFIKVSSGISVDT